MLWHGGQGNEDDKGHNMLHRKNPPEQQLPNMDFDSLFAESGRSSSILDPPQQQRTAPRCGAASDATSCRRMLGYREVALLPPARIATCHTSTPTGAHFPVGQEAGRTIPAGLDVAVMITAIIQSQNKNQLAIATASNASMMAFHTATAQALATKSGDKDSKLTAMKKRILQACSGQGDTHLFCPAQVYQEMEAERSTLEAIGRILRSLLQPKTRSIHKPNVFITPQLMQTVKLMCFSANGDKTHARCTKGITIFATPWRSIEAMSKDALEEPASRRQLTSQSLTSGNILRGSR